MYKIFYFQIFQALKIKSVSSINLVYAKKIVTNELGSMINLIIFKFRKKIDNFVTKIGFMYQFTYNAIIKMLCNLSITIKKY